MEETPTFVSYDVSAMEIVGLLWWNTGNDEKMFWQQHSESQVHNFQDGMYTTDTGMENFVT
jgi:hypothetical protein